jgi:S-adenosylmethionine:tRNA-ribosyltransferase-isomerase (queuine synthetase)
VTLHVGSGTFQPVQVEDLAQHRMHEERYTIPVETAAAIATFAWIVSVALTKSALGFFGALG